MVKWFLLIVAVGGKLWIMMSIKYSGFRLVNCDRIVKWIELCGSHSRVKFGCFGDQDCIIGEI